MSSQRRSAVSRHNSVMRCVLLALACAVLASAGEYAVLVSGFRLYADGHEVLPDAIRLHLKEGSIELPRDQVLGFELEEYAAPAPEPARSTPASPPSASELIERAALRHGLPSGFLHSVAQAESGLRQEAVSSKGAIGVMQLMPATARELGADPNNLHENIDAGTRYLTNLLLKYQNDPYQVRKALAAYNAGPAAVDRHNGIPPYPETQRYVKKVIEQYRKNVR